MISHRAIGEASENDIKLALKHTTEVVEWVALGQTFLRSDIAGVIMRVEGMGAESYHVEWAWKYANPFSLIRDWQEIKELPETETWLNRRVRL